MPLSRRFSRPSFPELLVSSRIARRRSCLLVYYRSPIRTHSRSAMAQHASESFFFAAPEGITTSVPPSFTLAPFVTLSAQVSHPLVNGEPLFSDGHWQTFATPEPVVDMWFWRRRSLFCLFVLSLGVPFFVSNSVTPQMMELV